MTKLDKKYFVDGKAEAVRERIEFDKFKLDPSSLTVEEIDMLLHLPEMDAGCLVRTNPPNKSGSAFSQMYEHCILAGFMRSGFSIKALVVHTERQDADGSYDYSMVPLNHIKVKKVTKAKVKVEKALPSEKKVPTRKKVFA